MIPKWMRRKQRQCFHHQLPLNYNADPDAPAKSYIKSQLIETGKAKMFWCDEELGGCGKVWII